MWVRGTVLGVGLLTQTLGGLKSWPPPALVRSPVLLLGDICCKAGDHRFESDILLCGNTGLRVIRREVAKEKGGLRLRLLCFLKSSPTPPFCGVGRQCRRVWIACRWPNLMQLFTRRSAAADASLLGFAGCLVVFTEGSQLRLFRGTGRSDLKCARTGYKVFRRRA